MHSGWRSSRCPVSFARLDGGLPKDLADSANDMTKVGIRHDVDDASGAAPFQTISLAAMKLSLAELIDPRLLVPEILRHCRRGTVACHRGDPPPIPYGRQTPAHCDRLARLWIRSGGPGRLRA
jgi:hypothetical protein